MDFEQSRSSAKELHSFHNSLAILLKAIEGQKTIIDLRNESYVYGRVEQADGFMNVVVKDCLFTDPRGGKYLFDTFFVHARNIRCVHIPPHVQIIPVIKTALERLNPQFRSRRQNIARANVKRTFRQKRLEIKQRADRAAASGEILSKQQQQSEKKSS